MVTLDSGTDDTHSYNLCIETVGLTQHLEILTDILQYLLLAVAFKTMYLPGLQRLVVHGLAYIPVMDVKTLRERNEPVVLIVDDRLEALQRSDMTLLADGTGQRQDNTLTQCLDTCLGSVAAMHDIINDDGHTSFG